MTKNYSFENQQFMPSSAKVRWLGLLLMFVFVLGSSYAVYGQSAMAQINLNYNGTTTTHSAGNSVWGSPCPQPANGSFDDVSKTNVIPGYYIKLSGHVVVAGNYYSSGGLDVTMYYKFYRVDDGESSVGWSTYGMARQSTQYTGCGAGNDNTYFHFNGAETGAITIPTTGGLYYLDVEYRYSTGGKFGGVTFRAEFDVTSEDIYLSSNGTGYKMSTSDGNSYSLSNVYITGSNGYFYNVYNGSTTKYWSHTCWNTVGTNCTANDPVGSVPGTKIPTVTGIYDVTFNKTTKVYTFTAKLAADQKITSAKVNMQVYNDADGGTDSNWYYLTGSQPTLDCHKDVGNLEFNPTDETPIHVLTVGSTIKVGGEVRTNNDPTPVKMHYRVYKKDATPGSWNTRTMVLDRYLTSGSECGNQGGQRGTQYQILASSGSTETFATEGEYYVEVYYSALGTVSDYRDGASASAMGVTGNDTLLTSWGNGYAMANPTGTIYQLYGFPMPGVQFKFRNGSNWYGDNSHVWPDGNAYTGEGGNITATGGTYNITFNSSTGYYNFAPYSATPIYFNNTTGANYKALIKVVAIVDEDNNDDNDGNYGFTDAATDPGCTNCTGLYESYMGLLIKDANNVTVANEVYNLDGARGSANTSNVRLGSQFPGITFKIGTEVKAWARGTHKMCGCSSWYYVYDVDDTDPVESDFPLPSPGAKFSALQNGKFTLMNTSDNLGSFHTPIPLNPENTSGMGSGVFAESTSENGDDSALPRRKYELLLRDLNLQGYNNISNSTYSLIGGFSGGADVNFSNVSGKDKYGGTYGAQDRMLYDYWIDTSASNWIKVRNNGAWTEQYGSAWSWPDGIANNSSPGNITSVPSGNYTVLFNNSTRKLEFSKTTLYRWKDYTNAATTTAVNTPVYEVACPSCGGSYKVAVALLCWASNAHDCSNTSTLYYHRDINQNKTYKGISLNPHHPDALDKPTNGAADNTLPGTNLFYVQSINILDTGRENRWNGTTWSQTGSSNPEKYDDVYFDADYTVDSGKSFTCVNMIVADGVTVTINNARYIEVLQQATTIGSGKIVVSTWGNFVQRCNNLVGQAYIEHEKWTRNIAPKDYAYWSSPVQEDIKSILETEGMGRMFYWDQATSKWVSLANTASIGAGRGFIAWNPGTTNESFRPNIVGTVNSGIVEVPVVNEDADTGNFANYALLGNPYPCNLDAQEFLLTNEILDGTLYFWTNNTRLDEGTSNGFDDWNRYQYSNADYASWNLTAGSGTAASAPAEDGIGNTNAPTANIGSGTGFFAFVLEDGDVVYNNDMRRTSGNSTTLFKSKEDEVIEDKSRLWVNISNGKGDFKQIAIGYLNGATTGRDRLYDSRLNSAGRVQIYTTINGEKFGIEGRPSSLLDANETIPVGLTSAIADEFTIFVDSYDGKFKDKDIFLKDKKLDVEHNLSESKYAFTTQSGTYDDRFELIIKDKKKVVETPVINEEPLKIAVADYVISISKAGQKITNVEFTNVLGKRVKVKSFDYLEVATVSDLIKANQVLIVKVTYADGSKETKKIIF